MKRATRCEKQPVSPTYATVSNTQFPRRFGEEPTIGPLFVRGYGPNGHEGRKPLLLSQAEGVGPRDTQQRVGCLSGPDEGRHALLTARLCKEAGLPKVTPHGLRGTHATASMRANTNPHLVAAALGHT